MVLSAVVSASLTWLVLDGMHTARLANIERDHQKLLAGQAEANTRALKAAADSTARMQKEKDDAIERANTRAAAQATAVAAARAQSDRLRRDLSDTRARLAQAPVEALREYADTVGELYGECEAELVETAAKADGHASDVQLMLEAWPEESD